VFIDTMSAESIWTSFERYSECGFLRRKTTS
jgi:hypothetical protein